MKFSTSSGRGWSLAAWANTRLHGFAGLSLGPENTHFSQYCNIILTLALPAPLNMAHGRADILGTLLRLMDRIFSNPRRRGERRTHCSREEGSGKNSNIFITSNIGVGRENDSSYSQHQLRMRKSRKRRREKNTPKINKISAVWISVSH